MTKNNLSEHLSWLCISKPSKPTSGSSVPVITDSSTAGFLDDQYSGFVATQEGLFNPGIDSLETTGDSSPHPKTDNLDSCPRVQFPHTSYTSHEAHPMARLQSGPKSAAKKQLLSQNLPIQLPSPVPTETGSTRRPIRDVYNAQFRTQPLATPSKSKYTQPELAPPKPVPSPSRSHHRIVAQSTRSMPISTVDAVDLTGEHDVQTSSSGTLEAFGESRPIWREDSASRQEPLKKRGRKRKSEEIESGAKIQLHDLRGPTPRTGRTGARLPSAGFVAIESYSDEAPPPYSTDPDQPRAKKMAASVAEDVVISSSDIELSQKDLAFTEEEYSVTKTSIRTETRKRKSRSQAPSSSGSKLDAHVTNTSEGAATSQTVAACTQSEARMLKQSNRSQNSQQSSAEAFRPTQTLPTCSQSQRSPRKGQKRFVADSEDDEEEASNLDSTSEQEFQKKEEFQTSVTKMPQYPTLPTVRETTADVSIANAHEVGPSKGETEELGVTPNAVERQARSKIGAPSPFQRDSPTKLASRNERQEPVVQHSLGSSLDGAQKASVESFLSIKPSMLQRYLEGLQAKRRCNAEAVYKSLLEGLEASPELTEQAAILSRQIQSVNCLVTAREEYDRLSQRKEDLKRKMIAAIEDGADMSAYTNELEQSKSIAQSLTQAKIDISKLLTEAAWNPSGLVPSKSSDLEGRSGTHYLAKGPEVVVQSTQIPDHTGGLLPDRDAHSRSSALAQTQYIRQTPVDRGSLTTPSKVSMAATRAPTNYSPLRSPTKGYANSQACCKDRMRISTPPPDPTDINTYFSPSKRRLKTPPTPDLEHTRADDFRSTNRLPVARNGMRMERGGRCGGIAVAGHDNQSSYNRRLKYGNENIQTHEPNFKDDEEALYSRTMGSPSRQDEEADDFGQYDDDEDMLEFAETLDSRPPTLREPEPESISGSRAVFAMTSGNELRSQPPKPSTKLSKPAPTSSMLLQQPWSRDVKAAMKERFHLRGFRQNQLEAINATLAGKDAFVLMPTGGGKSLCYQLPSIISSGRTRGVTIVISPLLSLMQDQVDHLQKLKIQAFLINSEVTAEHRRLIMESLRHPNVEQFIQLLYVTPEMISKSQALVNAFKDLHRRGKFARMVIDEAHCVSQWGHDFRPDYKLLGEVRQQFRGVPAMALTATATENVKVDVIHNLGITGCEIFTQSFNRPNLTYEVRSKGKAKDVLESMANTIKSTYKGQSGIVYCLSRQNCEDIAEKLHKEHGIKAHHYHAGMEPREKTSVQKQWQAGQYHVIVATIAFGMGIDKPDVRFVIHHTIPKSLEGYYQETGRAGRDGKRSGCYLYYGYQDTSALKRMIDDGEGSWEQKERQRKMLRNVVQFCENKSDCRRVQVLLYFNEPFRRENCNGGCDNCNSTSSFESQDFTDYAVSAVKLVRHLERENVTLLHCVDVFRGSKTKKIVDADHTRLPEYGAGADLDRGEIERLFYRLLSEDAIAEHNVVNKAGWPSQYVHLGSNHADFISGRRRLKIQIRISPNGKTKQSKKAVRARGTGVAASRQDFPQSTNVSSPVQAASRRRHARTEMRNLDVELYSNGYKRDDFVISDNDADPAEESEEDDEDAFEPIRQAGVVKSARQRQLGPPITVDHKLERLNPTHRMVVDEFMVHAKRECEKVMIDRSLRAQPFTDSILREMAINFPKDESELLEIRDIDPDKVERYGKRFLKLIRNAENFYENMMRANEDRPQDPNHQNVINISSDEDDDDYGEFDDLDDNNMASQEERSSYFQAAPEVDAFNAQFSQVQTIAPRTSSRARPQSQASGNRGGARAGNANSRGAARSTSRGGAKQGGRKGSGGFSKGKSTGGIARRKKASSNRTSNASSNGFNAGTIKRGGGSGFSSGGGIGMMPT